jgi:hypothetical protein
VRYGGVDGVLCVCEADREMNGYWNWKEFFLFSFNY